MLTLTFSGFFSLLMYKKWPEHPKCYRPLCDCMWYWTLCCQFDDFVAGSNVFPDPLGDFNCQNRKNWRLVPTFESLPVLTPIYVDDKVMWKQRGLSPPQYQTSLVVSLTAQLCGGPSCSQSRSALLGASAANGSGDQTCPPISAVKLKLNCHTN